MADGRSFDEKLVDLLGMLWIGDVEARRTAARGLGMSRSPLAMMGLEQALDTDEDAEVRRLAAWAAALAGDVLAVPALVRARQDPDPGVRAEAESALGRIGPPAAIQEIDEFMKEEELVDAAALNEPPDGDPRHHGPSPKGGGAE